MLQLKKFPDIPASTREEARESRPHPEKPHLRLLAREEGSNRWVYGKELPAFLSHLKRRRSPQERRDELQGRATIPRLPQMSHFIPGKTDFPALPRLSSRGSTHATVAVGQPCAKASRESLEGKPQICYYLSIHSEVVRKGLALHFQSPQKPLPSGFCPHHCSEIMLVHVPRDSHAARAKHHFVVILPATKLCLY